MKQKKKSQERKKNTLHIYNLALNISIHNYLVPLLDDEVSKASRMEPFALRYPSESGHSKNMHPMPDVKMMAVSNLWV